MKTARVYLRGRESGLSVAIADSAAERMRGLLGRDCLASNEALLLKRCGAVHTFGMRFAIDVVFLDRVQRIVAIHHGVPRRRVLFAFRARQTLEMPAGSASRHEFSVGDSLVFEVVR